MREIIERNRTLITVLAVLAIAAAAVAAWISWPTAGGTAARSSDAPQGWYTIDDGKSWFADRANRVVPFDYNGKPAVRCYVYTCDDGKTKFAAYLERVKPSAQKQFAGKDHADPWEFIPGSLEVKAPLTGDRGWVDPTMPQAQAIMTPRCPDGKGGTPRMVRAE
jgi:hypothetical protein